MDTNEPKFKSIRVKNFKGCEDTTLTFTKIRRSYNDHLLNREAFKFLRNCLTRPVQKVIEDMGGYDKVALDKDELISIELKIQATLNGEPKTITYFIEIRQNADSSIFIEYERLKYKPFKQGRPIYFLDVSPNKQTTVTNEQDFDSEGWEPAEGYHNRPGLDQGLVLNKFGQQPDKYLGASAVYQLITE